MLYIRYNAHLNKHIFKGTLFEVNVFDFFNIPIYNETFRVKT